jgi:hypothetical protein
MRATLVFFMLLALLCAPAPATPEFARRAMLSCNACHTVGTKLTEFGAAFAATAYRIPRLTNAGNAPVSIRGQAVYSSEADPTGLPKAIVDEVDILSAGPLGKHFNYGVEQYVLDGGNIGNTRETWIEYQTSQRNAIPLTLRAGLQLLPIPVDPERFRETNAHYALYDQTVGDNPFSFFETHTAINLGIGHEVGGLHVSLLGVAPHDFMEAFTYANSRGFLEAYRYDGSRVVAGVTNRFWRQGYGVATFRGRFGVTAALQTGLDRNAAGDGVAVNSSGGFVQARMQVGAHNFTIARYDGVNDSTGNFARSFTIGAGALFARAFRIEIEDQIFHAPETHNALSVVFGFGVSTVHEGSFAY